MRKRVALAQMLILDPEILLMDEPFSALDIQTRQLMENELLELWSANRKSVLFITHDLEEAISLSDRVVVLSAGPATHPIGEFAIDLPRPRDVAEIRMTPRFVELHEAIWQVMKDEVLKGYAQGKALTRRRAAAGGWRSTRCCWSAAVIAFWCGDDHAGTRVRAVREEHARSSSASRSRSRSVVVEWFVSGKIYPHLGDHADGDAARVRDRHAARAGRRPVARAVAARRRRSPIPTSRR